jgi:paraquat-inducible protein B
MSRKANPAIIGAFVLGAVLLAVAGVVVLTGDPFFRRTQTFVAYFVGSLEGLDVGAPVTFNGVRIGSVTDVRVVIDPRDGSIRTPVFFKVDRARLRDGNGAKVTGKELPDLPALVERGLRARLEVQSLVTGQLVVALNFYPNSPIRLLGLSKHYPEIPTIPSSLERLTQRLERLPVETLVVEATQTMRAVSALATAPEVKRALGRLDHVLTDVDRLVRDVGAEIDPLVATVHDTAAATQTTMAEAKATLTETRAVLAQLTPAVTSAIADYQALAQDARTLVTHADAQIGAVSASLQGALADAHGVLGDDSPIRYDLANALQEMTKAAQALRTLAGYLDRHPEALLTGKRPEQAR